MVLCGTPGDVFLQTFLGLCVEFRVWDGSVVWGTGIAADHGGVDKSKKQKAWSRSRQPHTVAHYNNLVRPKSFWTSINEQLQKIRVGFNSGQNDKFNFIVECVLFKRHSSSFHEYINRQPCPTLAVWK